MKAEYIIREISLSDLTNQELEPKVSKLINYFTKLFNDLKREVDDGGTETWYNKYNQWIFQSNVKHKIFWVYHNIVWLKLKDAYNMDDIECKKIIKFMFNYLEETKISNINDRNYSCINCNSFDIKKRF
jgi:hypothetical protein